MTTTPAIDIAALLRSLDAGDALLLLDVRNDDEFTAWRIESRRPLPTIHIPYFDFIEDAAAALARVPRGRPVVTLCAKGASSAMVAEMLCDAGIGACTVEGGMAAYGDYLEPVPVPLRPAAAGAFELWQVNRRATGCLSYIVRAGGDAVVVDPSRHVESYERLVRDLGARIVGVFDTHVHADHLSGGPSLAMRTGAPYYLRERRAMHHRADGLADGDRLRVGSPPTTLEIEILATPGHTPDSTSYLLGGQYLLTGDTLLVHGVGRPDLGDRALEWGRALHRTLHRRLARLPDEIVVLPAHAAGVEDMGADGVVCGRLGDLRRTPDFAIASEDAFARALASAVRTPPASYAALARANLGECGIDLDQVAELEHGKNQCTARSIR